MRSGSSPARPCAVARDTRHARESAPANSGDQPIGGHVLDGQHPVLEPEIANDGTRKELTIRLRRGGGSYARPAPRRQSTTSPTSGRSETRAVPAPRGPRSWQECAARRSSSACPAIARSTPTRSRAVINRWRARCGESRTRRKPVNQTKRPKTGTTISNKSRPSLNHRGRGEPLGHAERQTCMLNLKPAPRVSIHLARHPPGSSRRRHHRLIIVPEP